MSTQINLSNSQFGSWDCDNPSRKQIEINYETQFLINPILINEIFKKNWP
jgi:hypothetical protein